MLLAYIILPSLFLGRKIEFCFPGGPTDSDLEENARHEIFHAFQFGFKGVPFRSCNGNPFPEL